MVMVVGGWCAVVVVRSGRVVCCGGEKWVGGFGAVDNGCC